MTWMNEYILKHTMFNVNCTVLKGRTHEIPRKTTLTFPAFLVVGHVLAVTVKPVCALVMKYDFATVHFLMFLSMVPASCCGSLGHMPSSPHM